MEHGIEIAQQGISLLGISRELGNGSDTGKPFIDGRGLADVITVKARNVTITGFHIENIGHHVAWEIIVISWGADGCVISDNNLSYTLWSIINCASNFSRIINNTINNSFAAYGILLGPYSYNTVSGNVIENCPVGICVWDGTFNTIIRNRIIYCREFGIDILGASYNTFKFNIIEDNLKGLYLLEGVGNRVEKNNFVNNTLQASFYKGFGFTGNRWIQNYWGRPQLLPYSIQGSIFYYFIPWVQFDWRPALRPYDIL